ncbi:hypothetical protein QN277_002520 [Acacia crassicarpa]|uniref:Uncharacterized protein n=1 Tax=Acacia crassicarpa TaxID=499986 RepID=A0AAE1TJN5_9FABA|nr:hypothetical protein QN277_002520 [Acacia crassicarpa]
MGFKFKGMQWVGDIYQKFEEACQEDAVKHLGNRVQNVGDSVKRFCSGVVQEVLPLSPWDSADSPLESVAAVTKNKERVKENPVNNTIESFHDSDANNLPNNRHAQASIGHDLVYQVNDRILSNSCAADSFTTRKEVGEIDSCKENTVDVAGRSIDSSMVIASCATAPDVGVAGEFMTSQAGLLSCGSNNSMESNEGETSVVNEVMPLDNLSGTRIKHGQITSAQERPITPVSESDMEDIQLNDDVKLDESCLSKDNKEDIKLSDNVKLNKTCISVDHMDMELHAASSTVRRLRSYKQRIKEAIGRKKRLVKEYEQLAIWYGDSDMEFSEGTSRSSTTSLDSKNLQMQQNLPETEWELL